MVSFQCEGCGDIFTKKKLDQHFGRCRAPFTCIDCMITFQGTSWKSHTSCISEAQKYQGALYKEPKKGGNNNNTPKSQSQSQSQPQSQRPTHHAYVEDAEPTPPNTRPNSQNASHAVAVPIPPAAPSPPATTAEAEALNVYDYLSKSRSNTSKKRDPDTPMHDATAAIQPTIVDARPSDKKRKRGTPTSIHEANININSPTISDAAPSRHLLHTGLTGGLDRLLAPAATTSEDSDAATPLAKKEKEREREKKRHKERHHHHEDDTEERERERAKEKDKRKDRESKAREAEIEDEIARLERKKARRAQRALEAGPERKRLEYNEKESTAGGSSGPANDFLRLVAKGKGSSAGSSKGQSVWGALKMWRDGGGEEGDGEGEGEKRLWKGLRMRVNERGEVVLFAREE